MSATLRRRALQFSAAGIVIAAAEPLLISCSKDEESGSKEVLAVEDMMREHGLLRRALLVFEEAAGRLRSGQGEVPATQLAKAADIFHQFGEEYHERKLEEEHVFPAMEKAGGANAQLPSVLKLQHDRGREIVAYITSAGRIGTAEKAWLDEARLTFFGVFGFSAR